MSYASEVLADSPVGYWTLTEGTGSAADTSTNNLAATYQTGTTQIASSPVTGVTTATACDSNGYVICQSNAVYAVGDIFTLECWARNSETGTNSGLVVVDGVSSGNAYLRWSSDDKVHILKSGVADMGGSTTATSRDGGWHHFVWTKNGATNLIYIDSSDVTGAITNATMAGGTPLQPYISSDVGGSDNHLKDMAQVAIYATALSAARVVAHYNAASGIVAAAGPPLIVNQGNRW